MISKLTRHLTDNWYFYALIIPLLLLIRSISDGQYYVGGDVMIPIDPSNNLHKLQLWYSGKESLHYLHTLWYFYYATFSLFGITALTAQKVLIVLTYLVGFISTYLLHTELFHGKPYGTKQWAYLTALFFTFNPIHFLLVISYLPLYGFSLCLYLLLKSINSKKIIFPLLLAIAINFFFFVDLPQPKALLIFAFTSLLILISYTRLHKVNVIECCKRLTLTTIIIVSLNLWIIIPFVYSLTYGLVGSFVSQVPSHKGIADLGSAQLHYISRLFNLSIVNNYPTFKSFLGSWIFTVWSYLLWGIITLGLFSRKSSERKVRDVVNTFIIGTLALLFLAKGPNPPLGFIYTYLTIHIPIFRIFRTTSSVVIGLVFFYSALISLSLYFLKTNRRKIIVFVVIIHIIIFAPQYTGARYYNNIYNNPNQKGIKIPVEYFQTAAVLDKLSDEGARVLSIPSIDGYQNKKWNYSGADIISWISRAEFVSPNSIAGLNQSQDELVQDPAIALNSPTVADYILIQKDSLKSYQGDSEAAMNTLVLENDFFELYQTNKKLKLDLFYSSTPGVNEDITYKRTSATEYLITITPKDIEENMTLTFNDSYHPGWILASYEDKHGVNKLIPFYTTLSPNIGAQSYNLVNQWLISPAELCKHTTCEQIDGKYKLKLTVLFWPQLLLYFSILLSIITTTSILIYTYINRRHHGIST